MTGRPLPRRWTGPLGLYRPGSTRLHRLPAGQKLVALAVFSLLVVLLPEVAGALAARATVPAVAIAGTGCAVLLAVTAAVLALRVRVPGSAWRGALVLALVVGAGRAWTGSFGAALVAALGVLALVLAGAVLTATTPADAVLDALAAGARPLRRLGVRPDRAALAAVLMVRAVPALVGTLGATREAACARGVQRDPRTWLTPVAVRAVARAHATGEALAARGLGDL